MRRITATLYSGLDQGPTYRVGELVTVRIAEETSLLSVNNVVVGPISIGNYNGRVVNINEDNSVVMLAQDEFVSVPNNWIEVGWLT